MSEKEHICVAAPKEVFEDIEARSSPTPLSLNDIHTHTCLY